MDPVHQFLARQDMIDEIRLVDLKEETAKKIADNIGSSKIKTGAVNATDPDDVTRAAEGVDAVIDMVMPWMVPYVMEGALKAKANYINTAFDDPFWDKFVEGIAIDDMPFAKEFKEAGLTALFGCGLRRAGQMCLQEDLQIDLTEWTVLK